MPVSFTQRHISLSMLMRSALLRLRRLKVTLEVLKQCNLLLEFFGEISELVLG